MLWEDKVILSTLKKRAHRKDLRDLLKAFEKEIRNEITAVHPKNAVKYTNLLRRSYSQDATDAVEVTQNPTKGGINNGSGEENEAEKRPDLNVVQEMLFTDGALDMEKLLCLHLLAKQSFISRIRRTQVRYQLPRQEKHSRGNTAGSDLATQISEVRSSGHRYAVDLSSISFLSKKVHLARSQPAVSGNLRKKMVSQISSADNCCSRPEEHLERLVDSVLEALCEANPTKLCTLLQMECDEVTLSRVLSSHKVQRFMQQVCGQDMNCRKSKPMRCGARGVPELLRLQRAEQLLAERHLSPEDMLQLSQKLRDAGFRIDLLEDIEHMIDVLWREELANKKSESDITSDVESRKQTESLTSYSSSDSLAKELPLIRAEFEAAEKSLSNLVQQTRQQHSWQQLEQQEQQQQAPSLLSRLSAAMSTHSDELHQKVKADVWHAEATSSGETTGTFQQHAGNVIYQGALLTHVY